jgi:hypothetical protein
LINCQDSDGDLDIAATFMNCSPIQETVPGVEGIFLEMENQGDAIILSNSVSGQDKLLRYQNGTTDQILGLGSEVLEIVKDDNDMIWFCSGGYPGISGLYSYDSDQNLTKHVDGYCN